MSNSMQGYLIRPDNTGEPVGIPRTLRAMYEVIGCTTVDVVRLRSDLDMWVDDDGMYTAEVNVPATMIVGKFASLTQSFYGTCLFLGGADDDGNTVGLSPRMLAIIAKLHSRIIVSTDTVDE